MGVQPDPVVNVLVPDRVIVPVYASFRGLVAEVANLPHHPLRRVEGVHELDALIGHDIALVEVHLPEILKVVVAVWKVEDVKRPAPRVLPAVAVDSPAQVESFPCEERIRERLPRPVVSEMFIDHLSTSLFISAIISSTPGV